MKKLLAFLLIVIIIVAGVWYWKTHKTALQNPAGTDMTTTQQTGGTMVSYACNAGKTIDATLYDGQTMQPTTAGQPPVPGGSAHIVLSDGRAFDLKQTLSADGVRYSNGDPSVQQGQAGAETFVFWSKGNGALVLENNVQKSYIGCVETASDASGMLPKVYTNESGTFSIRLPQNYTVDESYKYQNLGPTKTIPGVKFTIPASVAAGTNLGSDSYVSVEQASNGTTTTTCTADKFLDPANGGTLQTMTDNGVTYSYLSTTDAGAGNRYEETVYALSGTNPCLAIRYFIHYAAIENYPAGAVKQFDEAALKATFDSIRRSLVVNQ